MKNTQRRYVKWASISLMLFFLLVGCATEHTLVNHSFEFDANRESPDVEVLNYQYGNSKQPGARPSEYSLKEGRIRQSVGIYGAMPRPDFLYVKWRIKQTGQVYEDTVDLKKLLPADITDHRIHFAIKGSQLYVYLISPEELKPNPCRPRAELHRLAESGNPDDKIFEMYCNLKIIKIYPN